MSTEKKEKDFLNSYNITKYEKPSIATDIAIFSILEEVEENYRKLPQKKLNLLLIRRGGYPYKDMWALPGGFLEPTETVEEAAARELKEETNVSEAHLEQMHVFSDLGRDPRGWILSTAFIALIDGQKADVKSSDDAAEAAWFQVSFKLEKAEKEYNEDKIIVKSFYKLYLKHQDMELMAEIEERKEISNYHEQISYQILKSEGLAFDHGKIIAFALQYLRQHIENAHMAFDLLPEYFTLTDLQQVYEIILDKELLVANFRRKIADRVIETNKNQEGAGHRPSKLYKRNLEVDNL